MRVFRHFSETDAASKGGAVVLGNFDGVHLGHQAVMGAAQAIARERSVPCGVMTFEPHPKSLFKPSAEPFRLTPFTVKSRLIARLGMDFLLAQHFDAAFAAFSAEDFVHRVLIDSLGAAHVVVGYDYIFGAGRQGNAQMLSEMGQRSGFGVTCVGAVSAEGGAVYSSTRTRDALRQGRVAEAAAILGRDWEIEGEVARGDQRGRTIGFPTANLMLDDYVRPAFGVYAVAAAIDDGDGPLALKGVANIGRRPTFDKADAILEVHLFDYAGDLYGRHLRVALVDFLRPERKFDGIDALKSQIEKDCRSAQAVLARRHG